ncbi:MAG: family 43 glycosylhydrolase [Candidatus Cryptobacteroides sp.]|uniref:family 43 glycosylhydrolase n=1 Tax=Candidatus Cryptobacteroides sp. TaxID=2952915 RepID=UPI002A7FF224|nr:family 43 glycosylhydrolase [Candidatus Cryptobacteroides sp.]MDY5042530.1 family 43 glycosylhydrolase [Candidatus Cryptobacteroides sp.]
MRQAPAQSISKCWNPDRGTHYVNPVINADYSDPDVCRVGVDYYMTSSSFCAFPGLQILHSTDLVNWELVGAALRDYPGPNWSDQRPWEVTGHGMRGDTSRVPGALEWRTVPQHGKGPRRYDITMASSTSTAAILTGAYSWYARQTPQECGKPRYGS